MEDFSAFFNKVTNQDNLEQALADHDNAAAKCIYDELFQEQQWVIDDPYRFKSLITPRRAGKTFCAIGYGIHTCLTKPGAVVVIVTLTLRSAKRLYWNPILEFSDKYGLNLRRPGGVHHTNAEARFENGSQLFLMGAETKSEIEKLRGGSYDLVIIDECKSFSEHIFREMVEEILIPACSDRRGTLMIVGTPGAILAGPFYEATYPDYKDPKSNTPITRAYNEPDVLWESSDYDPEWSRHTWTQEENTSVDGLWADSLKRKKSKRWADDNPIWLREYLGVWVSMGDAMVYAYSRILTADKGEATPRCVYRMGAGTAFDRWGLPREHEWRYVLGMDLGYEDDLAIVVAAYSPTVDCMYIVYEFKQPHMLIPQVAKQLKHIQSMFGDNIEAMVADTGAGGKMLVESINDMYDFFFVKAEKNSKNDFVELLNGDLYDGKLKVLADSELADEWLKLQWDLKDKTKKDLVQEGKLKEDRSCANHLSDACLYTWRFCLHHFSTEKVEGPEEESTEWYDDADMKAALEAVTRRDNAEEDDEWSAGEFDPDVEFDKDWRDTSWLT
jgi:hypothetical protein